MLAGGAGGGECRHRGACLMSRCLTGSAVGEVPIGFSFFAMVVLPPCRKRKFRERSQSCDFFFSSPFCRVAMKCETRGSGYLFLLEIPSKMGIFYV